MNNKKTSSNFRLRFLKEDIKEMEESLKVARQMKAVRNEQQKFEPRRLARVVFQEQDIDFNMPEAICGNLRSVKSEGSVLKDRFKSMQQRNILAPSVDVGLRRRREVKRFPRKSHKEEEPQPKEIRKKQQELANLKASKMKLMGKKFS